MFLKELNIILFLDENPTRARHRVLHAGQRRDGRHPNPRHHPRGCVHKVIRQASYLQI